MRLDVHNLAGELVVIVIVTVIGQVRRAVVRASSVRSIWIFEMRAQSANMSWCAIGSMGKRLCEINIGWYAALATSPVNGVGVVDVYAAMRQRLRVVLAT